MMRLVDAISQDARHAARALARTPGFTALAVITLALGIVVVATMFTVTNAALGRPLPFERPHQLYDVSKTAGAGAHVWVSLPELQDWQSQNRTFSRLAGSTAFDFNLRGNPPVVINATGVTPGYLELLGVPIHIGRRFIDIEYGPGSDRVVLLTYPFWQQRFAADPNVIGTTLELEGPFHLSDSFGRYTIVGVLAPEFWHFFDRNRTHIVLPLRASGAQMANRKSLLVERVIGRLRDISPSVAAEDLRSISARQDRESLQSSRGYHSRSRHWPSALRDDSTPADLAFGVDLPGGVDCLGERGIALRCSRTYAPS
jgi:putative ABC transport system permease protein